MSALSFALLGLVAREPLTGYELTRLLKERVGFFWTTSHSQVYPELARLEAEGLVTYQVVEQRERPDKKIYTITGQGLEALRRWVTTPVGPRPEREELVLRAFCVWAADPRHAAALFREHEQRHEEQLSEYERRVAVMEREWGEDLHRVNSPRFASYAAIRRGIGYEREYASWCGWVAEQLEAGTEDHVADLASPSA